MEAVTCGAPAVGHAGELPAAGGGHAQLLHVTDKTIEMHLSNIFANLGVSSRTQAAAALIRAGKT